LIDARALVPRFGNGSFTILPLCIQKLKEIIIVFGDGPVEQQKGGDLVKLIRDGLKKKYQQWQEWKEGGSSEEFMIRDVTTGLLGSDRWHPNAGCDLEWEWEMPVITIIVANNIDHLLR